MPTYHIENFGCRATQADGAAIERQFEASGLRAAPGTRADLVVLNTCTVTNAADQDARAAIRRVRRQNLLAKIVITGCYAQRAPEEVAALPGVSAVIGNSHKHRIAELALPMIFPQAEGKREDGGRTGQGRTCESRAMGLTSFIPVQAVLDASAERGTQTPDARIFVSDIFAHTELRGAPVFESMGTGSSENARTRPNLKIQDGCNNRCSFCTIPSVRGRSRSMALSEVIREVNALVAAGYRELVITGINLGRWGRDLGAGKQGAGSQGGAGGGNRSQRFEGLIEAILEQTRLEKLRISSVEPMDWSDELIGLVASSPRIAKHAHLPLQSGSDGVLRRMHRKYRPGHYREKIEKIRFAMPTGAIGADVMSGFPGETHAEFEATRSFIAELPLTYLHVFTYSARPGTPAADMEYQVPVQVARERNKILRDLAWNKKLAFMRGLIGHRVAAITLGTGEANLMAREGVGGGAETGNIFTEALTDNYQKLHLKGWHPANRWISARIEGIEGDALRGVAIQSANRDDQRTDFSAA